MAFAPDGMRESMLAMAETNEMVSSFKNGIRHAGWLYKLVGKSPLDVNWKQYWVSVLRNSTIKYTLCTLFVHRLRKL